MDISSPPSSQYAQATLTVGHKSSNGRLPFVLSFTDTNLPGAVEFFLVGNPRRGTRVRCIHQNTFEFEVAGM